MCKGVQIGKGVAEIVKGERTIAMKGFSPCVSKYARYLDIMTREV